MDTPSAGVKNAAGGDFSKYKVDGLKKFLKERGIQLSDGGKGEKKGRVCRFVRKSGRNEASEA